MINKILRIIIILKLVHLETKVGKLDGSVNTLTYDIEKQYNFSYHFVKTDCPTYSIFDIPFTIKAGTTLFNKGIKLLLYDANGTRIDINSNAYYSFDTDISKIQSSSTAGNAEFYLSNFVLDIQLLENSITGSKIKTGTITGTQIKDQSIEETHLATKAVTNSKLGDESVTNSKIANTTITTDKLNKVIDDTLSISGKAPDALATKNAIIAEGSNFKNFYFHFEGEVTKSYQEFSEIIFNIYIGTTIIKNGVAYIIYYTDGTHETITKNNYTVTKEAKRIAASTQLGTLDLTFITQTTEIIPEESITNSKLANYSITNNKLTEDIIKKVNVDDICDPIETFSYDITSYNQMQYHNFYKDETYFLKITIAEFDEEAEQNYIGIQFFNNTSTPINGFAKTDFNPFYKNFLYYTCSTDIVRFRLNFNSTYTPNLTVNIDVYDINEFFNKVYKWYKTYDYTFLSTVGYYSKGLKIYKSNDSYRTGIISIDSNTKRIYINYLTATKSNWTLYDDNDNLLAYNDNVNVDSLELIDIYKYPTSSTLIITTDTDTGAISGFECYISSTIPNNDNDGKYVLIKEENVICNSRNVKLINSFKANTKYLFKVKSNNFAENENLWIHTVKYSSGDSLSFEGFDNSHYTLTNDNGPSTDSTYLNVTFLSTFTPSEDKSLTILVYEYQEYITENTIPENILNSDDIINDLITGGEDKVLSAEQGKNLYSKIKDIDKYSENPIKGYYSDTITPSDTGLLAFWFTQDGELVENIPNIAISALRNGINSYGVMFQSFIQGTTTQIFTKHTGSEPTEKKTGKEVWDISSRDSSVCPYVLHVYIDWDKVPESSVYISSNNYISVSEANKTKIIEYKTGSEILIENVPIVKQHTTDIQNLQNTVGINDLFINVFGENLLKQFKNTLYNNNKDIEIVFCGDSITGLTRNCTYVSNPSHCPPGFHQRHFVERIWEQIVRNKPISDRWDSIREETNVFTFTGTWEVMADGAAKSNYSPWSTSNNAFGDHSTCNTVYQSNSLDAEVGFNLDLNSWEKACIVITMTALDGVTSTEINIAEGDGKLLASLDKETWIEANGFIVNQNCNPDNYTQTECTTLGHAVWQHHRRIWLKKVTGITDNITITYKRSASDTDETHYMYFWGIEKWNQNSIFLTNLGRGGRDMNRLIQNTTDLTDRNPDLIVFEAPLANETNHYGWTRNTLSALYLEYIFGITSDGSVSQRSIYNKTNGYEKTSMLFMIPHGRSVYYDGDNGLKIYSAGTGDEDKFEMYNYLMYHVIYNIVLNKIDDLTLANKISAIIMTDKVKYEAHKLGLTIESYTYNENGNPCITADTVHLNDTGANFYAKYLSPLLMS